MLSSVLLLHRHRSRAGANRPQLAVFLALAHLPLPEPVDPAKEPVVMNRVHARSDNRHPHVGCIQPEEPNGDAAVHDADQEKDDAKQAIGAEEPEKGQAASEGEEGGGRRGGGGRTGLSSTGRGSCPVQAAPWAARAAQSIYGGKGKGSTGGWARVHGPLLSAAGMDGMDGTWKGRLTASRTSAC